ncbi:kinase-like domain-containing protein [Mucor mucedo]|uniref:kinase-like domain-containing protein n=1 Tax=Mucor mucedo TaxID=29922 RepID=UPI00221F530B|nr:kinase-like domain-containing protein [Mucor mucedo]KAI7882804.1 kinase-like domain-containing protein [Mucor mucedo]
MTPPEVTHQQRAMSTPLTEPIERQEWYQQVYKKYGYEPKHRTPSYFGPYLLLHTLGEGEFAKVKSGVHVQTNQEVAIKLMRKDHIRHASLETKLEREISVLKSVRHPYIVKLFEVLTIKNYIGIVLQRAAGGELFDYILKHHYLQEVEAKRLFAQLISGVHYMHQKHIVHRDLKLENLLLSKDRDIIITDFGFANRFSVAQEDLMATSCGSPCYAAPELVINDENNYVGTAVDIWSCGVILFAMLCGYLPFDDDPSNPQGANINVLYKYILSTPLEIPKHASEHATDLLRLMLVPDPTKRCTVDQIRAHPWLSDHRDLLDEDWLLLEEPHMTLDARPVVTQKDTIIPLHARIPESRDHQPSPSPSFLQAKFISTLNQSSPSPPIPQSVPFNKIPNRSQSVQQPSSSNRERTTSENYRYSPPLPVHILPSVSERVDPQQQVVKTSRQKLMDWFNKRRPSISQSTMFNKSNRAGGGMPDRPASAVPTVTIPTTNPVRAMSIGKPLGSYAADFNDSKLRLHRGAVDQDALTSKAPNEVLLTIKESLQSMGIEMKRTNDFKLKCIRPMRKRAPVTTKRTRKISAVPFKLFFTSSTIPTSTTTKESTVVVEREVIYGEQGIDNGEEVQFSVELSKIENLPGLYVVDIKRTRGNIWAFKFLYHTLLDRLNLSGHAAGGYMAHRKIQQDMIGQEPHKNRISYMTTSSSGSSMMIFDESTLHK